MKIDTIHIHNFRGIIDQTFQLGDLGFNSQVQQSWK